MVLQTCHEKWCSGLISLQLDPLVWETVSPRTQKPKIVNESLRSGPKIFVRRMCTHILLIHGYNTYCQFLLFLV